MRQGINTDGGIMVATRHNPTNCSGIKLIREQSNPISGDTDLKDSQIDRDKSKSLKLLAEVFLTKEAGGEIIYDPRLLWNTRHICQKYGAQIYQSKTGHVITREHMRQENAVYDEEISANY